MYRMALILSSSRHIVKLLLVAVLLIQLSESASAKRNCFQKLELVIAIDDTASHSIENLQNVTAEARAIISQFPINPTETRVALITMSLNPGVEAYLKDINSIAEFDKAASKLTLVHGRAVISKALRLARTSVLDKARQGAPKVLILMKDRRQLDHRSGFVNPTEIAEIKAEAAVARASGVTIHAVGVGGVWNKEELEALYGTKYLLYMSRSKGMESSKSLTSVFCEIECNDVGVKERVDPCLMLFRRVVKSTVTSIRNSAGEKVCRTEVEQRFEECPARESCSKNDKVINNCENDNMLTVEHSWLYFNKKTLACNYHKERHRVPCEHANTCPTQRGDVIIMIHEWDTGGRVQHLTDAAKFIVESLNMKSGAVRVGIYTFFSRVDDIAPLRYGLEKPELLRRIVSIRLQRANMFPHTHVMLERAKQIFTHEGRPGTNKFAILICGDSKSQNEAKTMEALVALKEAGVTILVAGSGHLAGNEHTAMTAPLTDSNMVRVGTTQSMGYAAVVLAARICIELSPPNPKLCSENVSLQMTSLCMSGMQVRSNVDYKFDSANNCVKHMKTRLLRKCEGVCDDPITGSQYLAGETWTTGCNEFKCMSWYPPKERPPNKGCPGLNSICHPVGSPPFKCLDLQANEADTCYCIERNGRAVLVIERK